MRSCSNQLMTTCVYFQKSLYIGWTETLFSSLLLLQYLGIRTQTML